MRLLRVAAHCAGRRSRRGCERKKGTRWRDRMYKQYSRLCRLRQRRASMHHNCDRHAQGCREASTARRSPARRSLHQLRWASAARQAREWGLTARGVTGMAVLWASGGQPVRCQGREGGGGLVSHRHGRAKVSRRRAVALGRAFRAARVIRGRIVRWESSPPLGGGGGGIVKRASRHALPPPRPRCGVPSWRVPTGGHWP